jgi:hypothetical protein
MRTIGVDPAFTEGKNKKCSITREMYIEELEDGTAYLTVKFTCAKSDASMMRTCASSFYTHMMLSCQTMVEFGN